MADKSNPMPKLRALIAQGLKRIDVDMDQCPKEWRYGVQYELKYSGYVPLEPAGNVITYIKKKSPLNEDLKKLTYFHYSTKEMILQRKI